MSCLIDKDLLFDCDNPQQGGIVARLILINKEDWDNAVVTVDTGVTEEITDITLAAGGIEGFEFQVPKSSNLLPTSPLRAIDGVDGFDHTLDTRVSTIEELDRINISRMRFNKVVGIITFLEGRSQVFGQNVGLRLSDYQENASDPATGGTIQFIAKTPDNDPPEVAAPQLIAASFDVTTLLVPTV